MRVTIVLPRMTETPSGGLRVQYENAGFLTARGHLVTVVHPMSDFRRIGVRGTLRYGRLLLRHRQLGNDLVTWYRLSDGVRLVVVPYLAGWLLPAADATILTAWQTAAATQHPRKAAGRMLQLVYDYEFWMAGNRDFRARMAAAFTREDVSLFSPSAAVTAMLREIGREPVASTPPGIDPVAFGCDVPPENRSPLVGFAMRSDPVKAMPVMLAACEQLHDARPEVEIACFGSASAPLPGYIQAKGMLSDTALREFYNRCQVFVVPSNYEGWGLPSVEAMACGAALVTTANGGSDEFASHGINSLVVPPGEPSAIAGAVLRLLEDVDLRMSLSDGGRRTAAVFTTSRAGTALEDAILTAVDGAQTENASPIR